MKIGKKYLLAFIMLLTLFIPFVTFAASESTENEKFTPMIFNYTGNYQSVTLEPGSYRMEEL